MSKRLRTNRSFLLVWIGNGISELGGAFGTFCNSIMVYQHTGSTAALGGMWLLYFLPSLILQLFIGPFIDQWSRKKIMVFSQCARGLIFLIPLGFLLSGSFQAWNIFAVQIVIGLITPLYTPANQAILPSIVPQDQLKAANAAIDGTTRLMTFLAPVLGGFVVQFLGVKLTFALIITMFLLSGAMLIFINEKRNSSNIRKSWVEQFKEGTAYFFKQPVVVWLGIFLAFVQFGVGVTMVITLPYVTKVLSGTYTEYGYFMASFPLGYAIGTILAGKIEYKSPRILMLGSLIIGGLTYVSLGISQSLYLAYCTEAAAGAAMAVFGVYNRTICQQAIPNELMGKVFSVRLFIVRGAVPLGTGAGSLLSAGWGIRPLYLFIGSLICAVSLLGLLLPYFRFIDGTDSKKEAA